ncbi:hypothetical protein PHSC3_001810 [Chlamydiales bacterium STE3]|nr:hypothetical protein PHSC3_001810 [Chlamydiales bacterium STE3]
MPYITSKLENYNSIIDSFAHSQNPYSRVAARGMKLTLIPLQFGARAIDTIIGVGMGFGSLATLGLKPEFNKRVFIQLKSSKTIFAQPFTHGISLIGGKKGQESMEDGFFLSSWTRSRNRRAEKLADSKNLFKRQVTSRLTYGLLAVACIVTRTVDAVLSTPVTLLALVTLGKFKPLNNTAIRSLKFVGIVNDLFYYTLKCINPRADTGQEISQKTIGD